MGNLRYNLNKRLAEVADTYIESQNYLTESQNHLIEILKVRIDVMRQNFKRSDHLEHNQIINYLNCASSCIAENNIIKAYECFTNADNLWFEI